MLAAEFVRSLDREADAVRGQAAHSAEQGDKDWSDDLYRVEYGLRLVAHVFAAVIGELEADE